MFALLAVAQHDALVTAWHYKYRFKRLAPTAAGVQGGVAVRSAERYSYPSGAAAVAAASASVLSYIAEPQSKFLWRNAEIHRDSRVWAGAVYPSDVQAGWEIGLAVARRAQEWGEADRARTAHTRPIARQEGKWWTGRQTMPGWGKVKPWLMKSVADFRAPEPPAYDSPQFHGALKEVRQVADSRTAEQLLLAKYWDLGVGAISVPGMWDQTGIDLMTDAGFSEPRMARALALTNMAMMMRASRAGRPSSTTWSAARRWWTRRSRARWRFRNTRPIPPGTRISPGRRRRFWDTSCPRKPVG